MNKKLLIRVLKSIPGAYFLAELARLFYELARNRSLRTILFAPPGHFYSPLPNLRHIKGQPSTGAAPPETLDGIDLRVDGPGQPFEHGEGNDHLIDLELAGAVVLDRAIVTAATTWAYTDTCFECDDRAARFNDHVARAHGYRVDLRITVLKVGNLFENDRFMDIIGHIHRAIIDGREHTARGGIQASVWVQRGRLIAKTDRHRARSTPRRYRQQRRGR